MRSRANTSVRSGSKLFARRRKLYVSERDVWLQPWTYTGDYHAVAAPTLALRCGAKTRPLGEVSRRASTLLHAVDAKSRCRASLSACILSRSPAHVKSATWPLLARKPENLQSPAFQDKTGRREKGSLWHRHPMRRGSTKLGYRIRDRTSLNVGLLPYPNPVFRSGGAAVLTR